LKSDGIDYQRFVEDALRDAVRRLLAEVAEQGFPGDHHFYIGFRTGHPGVTMPRSLRDLYPEEMTIILQHQFWNLEVSADLFSVELSFNASRQRLHVPFAALTMFADPSAEFALRFEPRPPGSAPASVAGVGGLPGEAAVPAAAAASPEGAAATGAALPWPAAAAADGDASTRPGAIAPDSTADSPGKPGGEVIRFDPSRRK
jgi:uncharacterized protein